jgi:hypothetical protein
MACSAASPATPGSRWAASYAPLHLDLARSRGGDAGGCFVHATSALRPPPPPPPHTHTHTPDAGDNDVTIIFKRQPGGKRWQPLLRPDRAGGGAGQAAPQGPPGPVPPQQQQQPHHHQQHHPHHHHHQHHQQQPQQQAVEDNYTIILGSHRNSRLKFERNGVTHALVEGVPGAHVSGARFARYWVDIRGGVVSVGTGAPGTNVSYRWAALAAWRWRWRWRGAGRGAGAALGVVHGVVLAWCTAWCCRALLGAAHGSTPVLPTCACALLLERSRVPRPVAAGASAAGCWPARRGLPYALHAGCWAGSTPARPPTSALPHTRRWADPEGPIPDLQAVGLSCWDSHVSYRNVQVAPPLPPAPAAAAAAGQQYGCGGAAAVGAAAAAAAAAGAAAGEAAGAAAAAAAFVPPLLDITAAAISAGLSAANVCRVSRRRQRPGCCCVAPPSWACPAQAAA